MGSSTSNLSVRILLISTGVLSVATAINFCFPTVLNFAVYDVPVIWSVILSWLRPPYLYVVINGIIITIVASSRFQHHYNHHHHHHHDDRSRSLVNETNFIPTDDLPPVLVQPSFDALEHPPVVYETETDESHPAVVYETENRGSGETVGVDEVELPPVIDIETVPVKDSGVITAEAEDRFVVCNRSEISFRVREMPLVSSRFAHQRRMAKFNPEGVRSLKVAKPRKQETLESTWKAITDGRHMPLNRHLRKSDAFDNHHHHHHHHHHHAPPSDVYSGQQEPTSVNQRAHHRNLSLLPPSGGKLRKEGSLSHDELNRRVEAFIKKFNDEMRLQRQESLNRYMEMINRGV